MRLPGIEVEIRDRHRGAVGVLPNPAPLPAIREQVGSYPIRHAEAIQPPYLQACILDGLGKLPPLSQLRERFVLPEGDIIGCYCMGHAAIRCFRL